MPHNRHIALHFRLCRLCSICNSHSLSFSRLALFTLLSEGRGHEHRLNNAACNHVSWRSCKQITQLDNSQQTTRQSQRQHSTWLTAQWGVRASCVTRDGCIQNIFLQFEFVCCSCHEAISILLAAKHAKISAPTAPQNWLRRYRTAWWCHASYRTVRPALFNLLFASRCTNDLHAIEEEQKQSVDNKSNTSIDACEHWTSWKRRTSSGVLVWFLLHCNLLIDLTFGSPSDGCLFLGLWWSDAWLDECTQG